MNRATTYQQRIGQLHIYITLESSQRSCRGVHACCLSRDFQPKQLHKAALSPVDRQSNGPCQEDSWVQETDSLAGLVVKIPERC